MTGSSNGSEKGEVEIIEEEDESNREPTEEEVLEYAEFLGLDPVEEKHLLWIAREGVVAPVPHPWKACQEDDEVFYFNFQTSESIWDHPCDKHYRELLAKHRQGGSPKKENPEEADRSDGSGDEREASIASASDGSEKGAPAAPGSLATASSNGSLVKPAVGISVTEQPTKRLDDSANHSAGAEDSKSFVSEIVDSDSEEKSEPPASPSKKSDSAHAGAKSGSPKQEAGEDAEASKTFLSDMVSNASDEEKAPPLPATSAAPGASEVQTADASDEDEGDASFVSEAIASDCSEAGTAEEKNSPASSNWSATSTPRSPVKRREGLPDKAEDAAAAAGVASSGSSFDSQHSQRSADNSDKAVVTDAGPDRPTETTPSAVSEKPAASPSGVGLSMASGIQVSSRLDHGGRCGSSNASEVSEDFRSDWGAPSPLGSARSGTGGMSSNVAGTEGQSLEVSASLETGSMSGLGLSASMPAATGTVSPCAAVPELRELDEAPKSWAVLSADLAGLAEVLASMQGLRLKQAACLKRLKSGA